MERRGISTASGTENRRIAVQNRLQDILQNPVFKKHCPMYNKNMAMETDVLFPW